MSTYYEQMMQFVLAMVSADGAANDAEMRFLRALQKRFRISDATFGKLLESAKKGIRQVQVPEARDERKKLFELLVYAACADGNIAQQEEKILKTIASRFEIEDSECNRQIQQAKKKIGQVESTNEAENTASTCPKCGYRALSDQDPLIVGHGGEGECPACGIIISRYHDAQRKKEMRQSDHRYSIDAFNGLIAITSHHKPLTIRVTKGNPICTDPNATVAWSGSLSPEIKTDVTFKTFLGRGSGESIQMKFEGEGWVVLQPFEEAYFGAR